MDKHRPPKLLKSFFTNHRAENAERIFVSYLDHVWHFLKQDLSDDRIGNHVLPWHHYAVTLVENGRLLGRNIVDLCKLVHVFHRCRFAEEDQPDVSLMPLRSRQYIVK